MFLQGIHGLIDSSADKEIIDQAVKTSLAVEGVEGVRSINTRRMGQKNWIDLIIDVSEKKSILETHMIGEKVKEAIIEKIEESRRHIGQLLPRQKDDVRNLLREIAR